MTHHVGHPVALDRIVARAPTLTVGLGRVVVDPEGVALELVAQERRLPRDRPRHPAMFELHVHLPGQPIEGDDDPPWPPMGDVEGRGGSGRDGLWRSDWYVRGVPAEGDLELVVAARSHAVDVTVALDGDVLRRAAGCATPLWPAQEGYAPGR